MSLDDHKDAILAALAAGGPIADPEVAWRQIKSFIEADLPRFSPAQSPGDYARQRDHYEKAIRALKAAQDELHEIVGDDVLLWPLVTACAEDTGVVDDQTGDAFMDYDPQGIREELQKYTGRIETLMQVAERALITVPEVRSAGRPKGGADRRVDHRLGSLIMLMAVIWRTHTGRDPAAASITKDTSREVGKVSHDGGPFPAFAAVVASAAGVTAKNNQIAEWVKRRKADVQSYAREYPRERLRPDADVFASVLNHTTKDN